MLISIVVVGHVYKFHEMQLCFVKVVYLGQTVNIMYSIILITSIAVQLM